jgi:hypothetical protein
VAGCTSSITSFPFARLVRQRLLPPLMPLHMRLRWLWPRRMN